MTGKLQERLTADMKAAMKAGEKPRLGLIRMLINDLKNEQGRLLRDELSEDEEIAVLRKAAKMRKDAIDQARQVGREEAAANETRELEWIETYLPRQMSVEETEQMVKELLAELGIDSRKETGRFMKEWMARYKAVSDGKLVQQALGKLLDR